MTDDLLFTVSGFEILFLASALFGVWFAGLNLLESVRDFRALGGISNGRRAIAVSNVINETLRLSIHALYIIAGLFAAFTPARPDATALTVLISAILVYASWSVTAISFVSRRTRLYLMQHGLQNRDELGRFIKATNGMGNDLEE